MVANRGFLWLAPLRRYAASLACECCYAADESEAFRVIISLVSEVS